MNNSTFGKQEQRVAFVPSEKIVSFDIKNVVRTTDRRTNSQTEADAAMGEISREEVQARIDAAHARAQILAETMRADNATLRADLQVGLRDLKSIGESIRSDASVFYANASKTFAQIETEHERNKNATYALGYKVITYVFGTMLAIASIAIGGYSAWHAAQKDVSSTTSVSAPRASLSSGVPVSSSSASTRSPTPALSSSSAH